MDKLSTEEQNAQLRVVIQKLEKCFTNIENDRSERDKVLIAVSSARMTINRAKLLGLI